MRCGRGQALGHLYTWYRYIHTLLIVQFRPKSIVTFVVVVSIYKIISFSIHNNNNIIYVAVYTIFIYISQVAPTGYTGYPFQRYYTLVVPIYILYCIAHQSSNPAPFVISGSAQYTTAATAIRKLFFFLTLLLITCISTLIPIAKTPIHPLYAVNILLLLYYNSSARII